MTVSGTARGATQPSASRDSGSFAPLSLQSLSLMGLEALEDLFAKGTVPPTLDALDGTTDGRLLRLTGWAAREPLASIVRHVSGSSLFPWRGKRFEAHSRGFGSGLNRLALFGYREVLPFQMRVEPSAGDGRPCICLDYNLPENPRPLRRLRDELREVSPGLFMGPAYVAIGASLRKVLFFGVSR